VGAKSRQTTSRSEIRWMAIAMAPFMWVVGTVAITQARGHPLPQAATVAAVGAPGGLIAWAIYHALSRRNDGLAIFILALGVQNHTAILSLRGAVAVQIVSLLVTASLAVVSGLLVREPREPGVQPNDSPLWDPEIDPPPTR